MDTRDRYIQKGGLTLAPFPMYPSEVRDERASLGKLKNTEQTSNAVNLANDEDSEFSFQLIAKDIAEVLG